jgi:hypothetical protein
LTENKASKVTPGLLVLEQPGRPGGKGSLVQPVHREKDSGLLDFLNH